MSPLWCNQSYCLCRRRKYLLELKIRPLEETKFGGVGTFPVLTACINEIFTSLPPFGQDLCHIWCLQCAVMEDLVDGFYKKTPRLVEIALRIFLSLQLRLCQMIAKSRNCYESSGREVCRTLSVIHLHLNSPSVASTYADMFNQEEI